MKLTSYAPIISDILQSSPSGSHEQRIARSRYEETSKDVQERGLAIQEAEADQLAAVTGLLEAEYAYVEKYFAILQELKAEWPDQCVVSACLTGRGSSGRAQSQRPEEFASKAQTSHRADRWHWQEGLAPQTSFWILDSAQIHLPAPPGHRLGRFRRRCRLRRPFVKRPRHWETQPEPVVDGDQSHAGADVEEKHDHGFRFSRRGGCRCGRRSCRLILRRQGRPAIDGRRRSLWRDQDPRDAFLLKGLRHGEG